MQEKIQGESTINCQLGSPLMLNDGSGESNSKGILSSGLIFVAYLGEFRK